jgi:hypothetical protein
MSTCWDAKLSICILQSSHLPPLSSRFLDRNSKPMNLLADYTQHAWATYFGLFLGYIHLMPHPKSHHPEQSHYCLHQFTNIQPTCSMWIKCVVGEASSFEIAFLSWTNFFTQLTPKLNNKMSLKQKKLKPFQLESCWTRD